MKLEKMVEYSQLFEVYGNLLSDKMRKIFSDYYFLDLTLTEIATNQNISRQAVLDGIHKCENKLLKFENQLKFLEYKNKVKTVLDKIEKLDDIEEVKSKIHTLKGEL